MKKLICLLVLIMMVSGCASMGHLDNLRTENRQNILKLSIGLTKQEALDLMGNKSATDVYQSSPVYGSIKLTVNNPYRSEILQGKDKNFEVIYYYTDVKKMHRNWWVETPTVQDDELTPLIFDEGKLIGWGWSFLQENIQKYEIRLR